MYLRAAKTDAEAAGIETDNMADSVSKLRDEILALTGNKVDIMMSDGETFKSTYEILKELAEVWDSLSDVSQANITEKIGGKRNANVVTALLKNFDLAEDVLKTSESSEGSAEKENQKYLDSVQGRINVMKASFEALSADVMNSDGIKAAVSALTGLLNVLDKIVETFGSLQTVVGGIGLLAAAKNFGSSNEFALHGCESMVA